MVTKIKLIDIATTHMATICVCVCVSVCVYGENT